MSYTKGSQSLASRRRSVTTPLDDLDFFFQPATKNTHTVRSETVLLPSKQPRRRARKVTIPIVPILPVKSLFSLVLDGSITYGAGSGSDADDETDDWRNSWASSRCSSESSVLGITDDIVWVSQLKDVEIEEGFGGNDMSISAPPNTPLYGWNTEEEGPRK